MKQKLRLMMSMLLCMLFGMGTAWGQEVTYDFTESGWTVSNGTLSNGTVSITGNGSANFKMNTGYFILGKSGAYITLPIYDFDVEKIVVTGRSGASASTKMNVYVGENAVSTETEGCTGTNTYKIASGYQTAGNAYTIKVTSNHNAQFTKIEIYKKSSFSATATTTTIDASGINNTNLFTGTDAGTLTATVKANDEAIEGATVTWTSSDKTVATVDKNGAVTLIAAGTTTITASYAGVEDEYEASEDTYKLTVTNYDPNGPGTANNPYTVAQARSAIDAGTGVTGVYATGIVSEIVTAYNSQYGNISYNISDDGSTTADQLLAFRGKGINGANFTSEDDIQVGDVVVIYGDLTKYGTDTYEFAADNKLVSLVRPENPAVETATTIDANGITNTDVYTSTAAGTLTATVTANNEAIADAIVTWTSSNENVATIDANGTVTLVAAGTTTITASYAGVEEQYRASEATYELTVTNSDPNLPGAANNPYTVEQAIRAIDSGTGTTGVYVKGIVSTIVTPYNSQYGNISYKISYNGSLNIGQILAYRGKSYNGDNFTSEDDIQIGDEVIIFGNLTKYGTDTYEFEADNKLVSLVRPVNPAVETATTIDATGITNTDVYTSTAAGTLTATVTANNQAIADASVTWTSSNDNVATVDANGAVTLVAAGTTTITASYAGVEEEYRASEATYELTVTDSTPIETEDGVFDFTLGTDYGSGVTPTTEGIYESNSTWISGNVTLVSSGKCRWWSDDMTLRLYKLSEGYSSLTISVPDGYIITSIVLEGKNTDKFVMESDCYSAVSAKSTWFGKSQTVVFTGATTTVNISKITVTYKKEVNETVLFSADVTATATVSYDTNTTTEITDNEATILGGTMYVVNNESEAKPLINKNTGAVGFSFTNSKTYFKVELDNALQVGDVISAVGVSAKDAERGIWISTETSRPSECTASLITEASSASAWVELSSYTITEDDGLAGATTIYLYRATAKTTYFDLINITRPTTESVDITVTDAGYATYCSENALDLSEVTAYIITGIDADGFTLQRVTSVPANTGIILEGTGEYTVPTVERSDTDVSANKLVGVTEDTEIEPTIYVLLNGDQGVGFYKTSKTFTVGAHTAYLPADAVPNNVKSVSFNTDTPTGINGIAADKLENAAIYNLSGQRVARPEKGIYIINGKKVLVK